MNSVLSKTFLMSAKTGNERPHSSSADKVYSTEHSPSKCDILFQEFSDSIDVSGHWPRVEMSKFEVKEKFYCDLFRKKYSYRNEAFKV